MERTGVYNGVHYRADARGQWYREEDVSMVLGGRTPDGRPVFELDTGMPKVTVMDGYISSTALASIVDAATDVAPDSPRSIWISGWYDDLTNFVETGEVSENFGPVVSDFIADVAEGAARVAREEAERANGVADGLRALTDQLRREADEARAGLRRALDGVEGAGLELDEALGHIGEAVPFVWGMRVSMVLTRPDDRVVDTGVSDLYNALLLAEELVESARGRLGSVLEGGEDDDR